MASSLVRLNIHLIFHIKSTGVTMRLMDLPRIFSYLSGIIQGIGSTPFCIGGTNDHVHVLATLPKDMCLVDFVRTIKAKSSKWMKSLDPSYACFSWQDGYGAFSVSPSILSKTITYIANQEQHHKVHSFKDEYTAFLRANGVTFDQRFVFDE